MDSMNQMLRLSDVFPSAAGGSGKLYIKQWLSDVPIYRDVLAIVAESARRFWWGQEVSSATMAFAMFLAIEGRRRKIPISRYLASGVQASSNSTENTGDTGVSNFASRVVGEIMGENTN
ncbi:hypothetical protein GGR56DRAFT_693509 [Xylariaceae sp. FL0804]|nr:hypothetical protein GGR56DRAFT_693509 [Xylariaceae sp. FL0804]